MRFIFIQKYRIIPVFIIIYLKVLDVSENQVSKVIEAKEIMTLLPHRYPFLLVDRVLDYKEGEWLKAIKNISVNEPCFYRSFPWRANFTRCVNS